MSAFWIAGIGINVVFFVALIYWAVRSWRRGGAAGAARHRDDGS